MPTMKPEEYEKLYGGVKALPGVDQAEFDRLLEEQNDWNRRVARRGYLFDEKGHPWRVPDELIDLYREKYPELGLDVPRNPKPTPGYLDRPGE